MERKKKGGGGGGRKSEILESRRGEAGGGYEVICTDSVLGTHIRAENRAIYFMEQASNW